MTGKLFRIPRFFHILLFRPEFENADDQIRIDYIETFIPKFDTCCPIRCQGVYTTPCQTTEKEEHLNLSFLVWALLLAADHMDCIYYELPVPYLWNGSPTSFSQANVRHYYVSILIEQGLR